jgi:hypothetical protein
MWVTLREMRPSVAVYPLPELLPELVGLETQP